MNSKIEELLDSPWFVPTVIGVFSFGSGLGLGFFLGKKKVLNEIEVHEVPVMLGFDADDGWVRDTAPTIKPPKVVIDEEVAAHKGILTVDSLSELRPSMVSDDLLDDEAESDEPDEEPLVITPDEIILPEWNWEKELPKRTETAPYILTKDEFYEDENNFSQLSLTYFAADETLADEDNAPIYNYSSVTGPLLFGHGSGQEDVVYVRNNELRAEYEITRVDARYAIEVLGYELEHDAEESDIKHSKHMKFRME